MAAGVIVTAPPAPAAVGDPAPAQNLWVTGGENGWAQILWDLPSVGPAGTVPSTSFSWNVWDETAGRYAYAEGGSCSPCDGVEQHSGDGTGNGTNTKMRVVVQGLTPGHYYHFDIFSFYALPYVAGPYSYTRSDTFYETPAPGTTTTPPGPPRNVSASPGDGTADVVWDAPLSSGTSPISGYSITIHNADGSTAGQGPSCGPSCLGAQVSGLTNGRAYYFSVFAHTADGSSSANSNTVTPVVMSAAGDSGACTYGSTGPDDSCNNGTTVRVMANSSSQASDLDGWHVQMTAAGGMQVPTRCVDDYNRPFYYATATPSCPLAGANARPVQISATDAPWRDTGDFVAIGYFAGCIRSMCTGINPNNGGVYKSPYVDGRVNGQYMVGWYSQRLSSPEEHTFDIQRDRAANQWRFLYDGTSLTGMDSLIGSAFPRGRANAGTEAAANRRVALNQDEQYGSHLAFRSSSGSGYVAPGWLSSKADGGCTITFSSDASLGVYFRSSGTC